jgi:predicted O-methyltransferase YrrM
MTVSTRPRESTARLVLDVATDNVLAELEAREAGEQALAATLLPGQMGVRRDEFLLSVGGATGTFLNVLIRESKARRILELGTSYGYSTVWLAHAARETGGRVITVDVSAEKQAHARAVLARSGLDACVEFHAADALTFLTTMRDEYDVVLLDLWKETYVACIDALSGQLRPGATIVADNMIEPPIARTEAARYLDHVDSLPDLQTVVLPIGNGLAVSRYQASSAKATLWPST